MPETALSKSILSQAPEPSDVYVDLDGTLLRTDLLLETAWQYLKYAPWRIFQLIALMFRGRAAAKAVIARKVRIDPQQLPYETPLLDQLRKYKAEGHRVTLVTASHWSYAQKIAKHLGLFDEAHGSTAKHNLKGAAKLRLIQDISGKRPFIYAGDSVADRPIWKACERAIFVNAPRDDVAAAQELGRIELVIQSRTSTFVAFLQEMRLHQWSKNALLFVPLLTSHSYDDVSRVAMVLIAFLSFGLCASGHYFLNDMLDLAADRAHETKRFRPLASGDLSLAWGAVGALILPVAAFTLSIATLPWRFSLSLAAYFALTNLYSFYLKRVSTADVFALAMLYTIRVVAGAAAISVVVSSWLLTFSVFTFVSLAYLKRYIELAALGARQSKAGGRGYSGLDAETVFVLGIANATASTIVFAFYISSPEVRILYREPDLLWALCILLLYWNNRIWVGARRGKIHDDPIVFAIRDKVSRLVCLAGIGVVVGAHLLP